MIKVIVRFLSAVLVFIMGFCMGCSWIFKRNYEFTKDQCRRENKYIRMFGVLDYWFEMKRKHKEIETYFRNNDFRTIAVYGIGYLGKHFVEELDQSDITVKFIVDKKAEQSPNKIAIYRPDDLFPEVDVIVVTAIVDFDDISDLLESKVDCPIVSLEDIIYEL